MLIAAKRYTYMKLYSNPDQIILLDITNNKKYILKDMDSMYLQEKFSNREEKQNYVEIKEKSQEYLLNQQKEKAIPKENILIPKEISKK